ncbi:MAG: helix-turn-helix domain-containing protein [Acidimicrobiales bacterium]
MGDVSRPVNERSSAAEQTSLARTLLLEARRRSGLSQRELARRAHVSRSTVAEIELGTRDPGLATLRRVLNGAGVDLDIRVVGHDDHDEVLERSLERFDPEVRENLERGFDRFVTGLGRGLATSRPLKTHG